MRTGNDRVVVAVAWTAVAAGGTTRKAVGGFLRYVQYRDKHRDQEPPSRSERRADAELRYVAHRDRAAGRGRLFDAAGTVGDEERRALATFVARAAASTKPQLWRDANGIDRDRRRALYRFVISPERAEGLDLRRLTLSAVSQLEADAGGPVRWIAAEHRNTAHPHVHLLIAGFRETEDGRVQGLVINKQRLERLKEAVGAEIYRERGLQPEPASTLREETALDTLSSGEDPTTPMKAARIRRQREAPARCAVERPREGLRTLQMDRRRGHHVVRIRGTALLRMAARYRWQAEREAAGRGREIELEVA